MTIDEVFAKLRTDYEAQVQADLDWETAGNGTVTFVIGANRVSKQETETQERDAALAKDALYATIKELTAKVAALETAKV